MADNKGGFAAIKPKKSPFQARQRAPAGERRRIELAAEPSRDIPLFIDVAAAVPLRAYSCTRRRRRQRRRCARAPAHTRRSSASAVQKHAMCHNQA
jgi:hypothetical protein